MMLAILVFVALFMYFFDPRGNLPIENELMAILGYCSITAIVMGPILFIAPQLFPNFFDPEKFTFGKYLLVNWICVELISLLVTPFNQLVVWPNDVYCATCILSDHRISYIISFIILLPASYMIKAWVLSQNLQLAQETNERLLQQKKALPVHTPSRVIIEADTNEQLSIDPDSFLYAEAQDNYVQIFWKIDENTQNKMLRLSLSRLEEQLNQPYIERTHRSYIVNLDKVTQVKGNSNGLRLALENEPVEIPVSRAHAQAIRDRLPAIPLR